MMAGINAAKLVKEEDPFIIKRSEGYIGVLIDDLVNKGTKEPYRMFTSRAEYRILLRQDNADLRLSKIAANIGMAGMEDRLARVHNKEEGIKSIERWLENTSVSPEEINPLLESLDSSPLSQKVKMVTVLSRPGLDLGNMRSQMPHLDEFLQKFDQEVVNIAETQLKYEGYIKKEQEMVDKMERLENVHLAQDMEYKNIVSLSAEAREKLSFSKPRTIGQASRISGVSPSDISVLLIHVGR
jgi:tRNA uridine 5-carboxymethylaminomethyl modification enzyme